MARRWDRATGSTSTVHGVRDPEDSAGDSNTAAVSVGGYEDAPVDSTQAQHHEDAREGNHSDDDGEEVEGASRGVQLGVVDGGAGGAPREAGSLRQESSGKGEGGTEMGPQAVDSRLNPMHVRAFVGSIGDGFAETAGAGAALERNINGFAIGSSSRGGRGEGGGVKRSRLPPRVPPIPIAHGSYNGNGSIPGQYVNGLGSGSGADDGSGLHQPWDVSVEEMLPAAKALRQQAETLLQNNNYAAAQYAYDHALRFVEYDEIFDGAEAKVAARAVKVACLVGASACALERGDATTALQLAGRALHLDPNNVNALIRRAAAKASTGTLDDAAADLDQALHLVPGDVNAIAAYNRVQALRSGMSPGFGAPATANDSGAIVANGGAGGAVAGGYPGGKNGNGSVRTGGRGGGGRGDGGSDGMVRPARPAASSLMDPPPVPLFNANAPMNGMLTAVNSPVPPGTAAAVQALETAEAEDECEGHLGVGVAASGVMEIGSGGEGQLKGRGGTRGSNGGGVGGDGGTSSGFGTAHSGGGLSGGGGDGATGGGSSGGGGSVGGGGGYSPNGYGYAPAYSGGFSGGGGSVGGGLSGGPAYSNGRLSGGGDAVGGYTSGGGGVNAGVGTAAGVYNGQTVSGGISGGGQNGNHASPGGAVHYAHAPFDSTHKSKGSNLVDPTRTTSNHAAFSGAAAVPSTGGAGTGTEGGGSDLNHGATNHLHSNQNVLGGAEGGQMGQTAAPSGSLGHASIHKNGPALMAQAMVANGGDESEEDGEEGVSPEFVPVDSHEEGDVDM